MRIEGRRGYVDPTGDVVIAPRLEQAGPFQNGFAEVVIATRTGAIDPAGQVVIGPRFARVAPFVGDGLFVEDSEGTIVSASAKSLSAVQPWASETASSTALARAGSSGSAMSSGSSTCRNRAKGWSGRAVQRKNRALGGARIRRNQGRDAALRGCATAAGGPRCGPRRIRPDADASSFEAFGCGVRGRRRNWTARGAVRLRFARTLGRRIRVRGRRRWRSAGAPARNALGDRWFHPVDRASGGGRPRVRDGDRGFAIAPDGSLLPDLREGQPIVAGASGLTLGHRGVGFEVTHPALPEPLLSTLRPLISFERLCNDPVSFEAGGKYGFVSHVGHVVFDPAIFESQIGFIEGTAAVKCDGSGD